MEFVEPKLHIDKAGIAIPTANGYFEVEAWIEGSIATPRQPYSFPMANTVGNWVATHGAPFVGESPNAIHPFPGTLADFCDNGFLSNCVLPLELGGSRRGVVFFLSRQRGHFGVAALHVLACVKESLQAFLHVVYSHVLFHRPMEQAAAENLIYHYDTLSGPTYCSFSREPRVASRAPRAQPNF